MSTRRSRADTVLPRRSARPPRTDSARDLEAARLHGMAEMARHLGHEINNTLAAIRKYKTGVQGKERVEFDLDGLHDQLACPSTQDFGERIVDFVFLSE